MKAPIRPVRGAWPDWLQRRGLRHFYLNPAVIADEHVTPDDYRRAMFGIFVGGTIKITWAGRHAEADEMLIRHLEGSARIADIGASDGSTSVDLIKALPMFHEFVISDRFLELGWSRALGHTFLFDRDDVCILVAGKRLVAWPHLSAPVRWVYAPLLAAGRRQSRQQTVLLNPDARRLIREDPRVAFREHDVFQVWPGSALDVIKTANLLRRLYFDDPQLVAALEAIHASLAPNGLLLLADDSRVPGEPTAAGLYRRTPRGFETVETTARRPEIDDLVLSLDPSLSTRV